MTFADAEARCTASVMSRLTNATCVVAGGSFPVIFDKAYLEQLGVVAGSNPVCMAQTAELAARSIVQGSALTISGATIAADNGNYVVVDPPQADGAGISLLKLRRSA